MTPRAIKLGILKQKRKKHGPTTPIKKNKHGSWRWTVAKSVIIIVIKKK